MYFTEGTLKNAPFQKRAGLTGTCTAHWSNVVRNVTNAYRIDFSSGDIGVNLKTNVLKIRCVRGTLTD